MEQIEGLDVLDYVERPGILPQLHLGCKDILPENSVIKVSNYLAARLRQERPKDRVYSDPDNGVIEVYSVDLTAPRHEKLAMRLRILDESWSPGRVYV